MNSITALITYTLLIIGNFVFGQNIGKTSDIYRLELTPPPITFAIWGVIYTGILVVIIKSFLTNSFKNGRAEIFTISSILNVAWLITFSNTNINLIFQYILILLLYVTLLVLYASYAKEKYNLEKQVFGIYLGWVSIAQILSFGIFLVKGVGIPEFLFNIIAYIYLFITPIGFYIILGSPFPLLPYAWLFITKVLF